MPSVSGNRSIRIAVACLLAMPACFAQAADRDDAKETAKDATVAAHADPEDRPAKTLASGRTVRGRASYYAKSLSGRKTASGDRYDPTALTAAHRTLPLGTKVKVVNPKNDRSVIVTVNDRGPVPKGRMLDVSSAAADALGMKKSGVTKVYAQVVGKEPDTPSDTREDAKR